MWAVYCIIWVWCDLGFWHLLSRSYHRGLTLLLLFVNLKAFIIFVWINVILKALSFLIFIVIYYFFSKKSLVGKFPFLDYKYQSLIPSVLSITREQVRVLGFFPLQFIIIRSHDMLLSLSLSLSSPLQDLFLYICKKDVCVFWSLFIYKGWFIDWRMMWQVIEIWRMGTNSSNGEHQTTTKPPPMPSPLRNSKFFQVRLHLFRLFPAL